MKLRILWTLCAASALAATLPLAPAGWAEEPAPVEASAPADPPQAETPTSDAPGAEAAALHMLQLRLQDCEAKVCAAPAATPAAAADPWRPRLAAWGSYMGYTDAWNSSSVSGISLLAGADRARGGWWLAATTARTALNYQSDNFWQTATVAGGWAEWGALRLAGSAGYLTASSSDLNGSPLAYLSGQYRGQGWGAELGASGLWLPDTTVVQVDPRVYWSLSPSVDVAVGLRLSRVDSALRPSLRLGASWRPFADLELSALGWYGRGQYALESAGLSVWTGSELYKGGYRLSASYGLGGGLALDAVWSHDLGTRQDGKAHSFDLLGGTVGLRWQF
ncbi:MAG: hypothetical protein HY902_16275 [Deltaproteobacteria bacterium]|nr:hypothetical protein [Deltaproteobacteria bacterium]